MSGSQIEGTSRKWNKPSENKTQGIRWRGRLRDKIGERPPSLSPSPRAFFASFLSWSLEQTIDNPVRALQINAWANVLDRKPLLAIKVSSRTWLWAGVCSNCPLRLFWDEPCFLCNLILANTEAICPTEESHRATIRPTPDFKLANQIRTVNRLCESHLSRTWLWAGVCSNCTIGLFWDESCFLYNLVLANTEAITSQKESHSATINPTPDFKMANQIHSTGFTSDQLP